MYITQKNSLQLTFHLKIPFFCDNRGNYQIHQPSPPGCPQMPLSLKLRSYQHQAVNSWFAKHGRGTLKMANNS
ncbi:hypothetical protein RintRC_7381 [Richelia intracellularis]|nr:hypothetical protein RintRC_7381 [Richelia intracellularis]